MCLNIPTQDFYQKLKDLIYFFKVYRSAIQMYGTVQMLGKITGIPLERGVRIEVFDGVQRIKVRQKSSAFLDCVWGIIFFNVGALSMWIFMRCRRAI